MFALRNGTPTNNDSLYCSRGWETRRGGGRLRCRTTHARGPLAAVCKVPGPRQPSEAWAANRRARTANTTVEAKQSPTTNAGARNRALSRRWSARRSILTTSSSGNGAGDPDGGPGGAVLQPHEMLHEDVISDASRAPRYVEPCGGPVVGRSGCSHNVSTTGASWGLDAKGGIDKAEAGISPASRTCTSTLATPTPAPTTGPASAYGSRASLVLVPYVEAAVAREISGDRVPPAGPYSGLLPADVPDPGSPNGDHAEHSDRLRKKARTTVKTLQAPAIVAHASTPGKWPGIPLEKLRCSLGLRRI